MPHDPPPAVASPPASPGLEAVAEAAAHRAQPDGDPDEILAALPLPDDLFAPAAAAWQRAIDDELAAGGHALLTRFADRFAEARARLAPPVSHPLPDPDPPPDSRPLRALHQPPWVPDIPITDTTLRLDAGPGPAAAGADQDCASPFPLTRVKRRGLWAWLGRLFGRRPR